MPADNTGQPSRYQMNSVMPALIANKHDDYLRAFIKTGQHQMIDRIQMQMVVTNERLLIPVNILIKLYYS